MPIDATLEAARRELELGNKWRAKEIIRSSFGNYGYDPDLYRFYGEVLLSMEDRLQAGKYLFFSKETLDEGEKEAVTLFLDRHGTSGYQGVLQSAGQIPFRTLSEFPPFVAQRLRNLGASEELYGGLDRVESLGERVAVVGCSVFCIAVVVLTAIGLRTVAEWLF